MAHPHLLPDPKALAKSYCTKHNLPRFKIAKNGSVRIYGGFHLSPYDIRRECKLSATVPVSFVKTVRDEIRAEIAERTVQARSSFIQQHSAEIARIKDDYQITKPASSKQPTQANQPADDSVRCELNPKQIKRILSDDPKNIGLLIDVPLWVEHYMVSLGAVNIKYLKSPDFSTYVKVAESGISSISRIKLDGFTPEEINTLQEASINSTGGRSLTYIRKPSERIKLKAIMLWRGALSRIKNPTEKMKRLHKMKWVV